MCGRSSALVLLFSGLYIGT